jgi:hypothetical protein
MVKDGYSGFVTTLHNFPHPGFTFAADNTFPPTSGGEEAAEYWKSTELLALFVAAVGLGFVFLLIIRYVCRYFSCCGCVSRPFKKETATAIGQGLCILVIIAALASLGSMKGAAKFHAFSKQSTEGITSMVGTLNGVASVSIGLDHSSDNLQLCRNQPDYGTCNQDGGIGQAIDRDVRAIDDMNSKVPVAQVTSTAHQFEALTQGNFKKAKRVVDASVILGAILWTLLAVLVTVGVSKKQKFIYNLAKLLSMIVLPGLAAIVTLILVMNVVLADACIGDPRAYVVYKVQGQVGSQCSG